MGILGAAATRGVASPRQAAHRAGRRRELDDTDRRFCAPVGCWLPRRSVRLWASTASPERAICAVSDLRRQLDEVR
jgi:hypothetical protein